MKKIIKKCNIRLLKNVQNHGRSLLDLFLYQLSMSYLCHSTYLCLFVPLLIHMIGKNERERQKERERYSLAVAPGPGPWYLLLFLFNGIYLLRFRCPETDTLDHVPTSLSPPFPTTPYLSRQAEPYLDPYCSAGLP